MDVVATVQARMGSSRLPGKMMLPLAGEHVLTHDIQRINTAKNIDQMVVATSTKNADDIIERYAGKAGAAVFRGSESDVLDRMFRAADQADADIVVRITGDCPLLSPKVIDTVVEKLVETSADYSSNIIERTFPRGLDIEAFTFESFEKVHRQASSPHQREHVTLYYHENPNTFDLVNVGSDDVFEEPWMHDRTDLRLTLDEADDYELLRTIYETVPYTGLLDVRDAIKCVDENELYHLNKHVEQKTT